MKKVWICMFYITILFPLIIAFFYRPENINNENRELAQKPEFILSGIENYPRHYEEYLNDHIPFRTKMISVKSHIMYYLFKDSPSADVLRGKNGWLFFCPHEMDTYKQVNGLGDEDIQTMIENLSRAQKYLNGEGIEFYVFVAPNKSAIYDEYIPEYVKVNEVNKGTEDYISILKENGLNVIYPKKQLLAEKERNTLDLYYPLDTHWNDIGGYIGAKVLLKEFGIEIPEISTLNIENYERNHFDLPSMMGMPELSLHGESFHISGYGEDKICYTDLEDENNARFRAANPVSDKKILFIRDSFMTAMEFVIAAQFKESYMPHMDLFYQPEMIEKEAPDIVVFEIVERSFNYMEYYKIIPE